MAKPRYAVGDIVIGVINSRRYKVTRVSRMFLWVVDEECPDLDYCERKRLFKPT